MFDKNYNFLDFAWDQINGGEQVGASPKAAHDFLAQEYTAKEEGYIYVYVSNENPTLVEVYFDDIKVKRTKSRLIQGAEYYAYGMQTAGSWTRDGETENNFLANGGTELNRLTGLYDLDYRQYDPVLGRMNQVDPAAAKYASLSPYNFGFNNPVMWNDPMGADPSDDGSEEAWYMRRQYVFGGLLANNSENMSISPYGDHSDGRHNSQYLNDWMNGLGMGFNIGHAYGMPGFGSFGDVVLGQRTYHDGVLNSELAFRARYRDENWAMHELRSRLGGVYLHFSGDDWRKFSKAVLSMVISHMTVDARMKQVTKIIYRGIRYGNTDLIGPNIVIGFKKIDSDSFTEFNWLQTIESNGLTSEEVTFYGNSYLDEAFKGSTFFFGKDEEQNHRRYVGLYPGFDEVFHDTPTYMETSTVTKKFTTTLFGRNALGEWEPIVTFQWGFKISKGQLYLFPVRFIVTPDLHREIKKP